jgi:hypothetical protein
MRHASNFSDMVESLLSIMDSKVFIIAVFPVLLGIQILYTKGSMKSSYMSSNGYHLEEDDSCHWWLKQHEEIIANSKTPYPLIEYAAKFVTIRDLLEMAAVSNLNPKFILINGSSLSELKEFYDIKEEN